MPSKIKEVEWQRHYGFTTTKGKQGLQELKATIPHTSRIRIDGKFCVRIDAATNSSSVSTGNISEWAAAFAYAKSLGYETHFRIRTEPSGLNFNPSNPAAFFNNHAESVAYWARFCQNNNIDAFTLAIEFDDLIKNVHSSGWNHVINRARDEFDGELHFILQHWNTQGLLNEILGSSFLNHPQLTHLGVSAYFVLIDDNNYPDSTPSVAQMLYGWHNYDAPTNIYGESIVEDHVGAVSRAHGKPMMIIGGTASHFFAAYSPWKFNKWAANDRIDLQAQDNYYEAELQAFADKDWCAGFNFDGCWQAAPLAEKNPSNWEFNVMNKPAAVTIENWFAYLNDTPTPPPNGGDWWSRRTPLEKTALVTSVISGAVGIWLWRG